MTAMAHAVGIEMPRFMSRFTRSHYQHKGRRVMPTSWQMQIFGSQLIVSVIEKLGL